jgi:hypothetical protein
MNPVIEIENQSLRMAFLKLTNIKALLRVPPGGIILEDCSPWKEIEHGK